MQEVLVNRLGGLSLPRKSVVRLTDRPDMTLDVYRGRKTTIQYKILWCLFSFFFYCPPLSRMLHFIELAFHLAALVSCQVYRNHCFCGSETPMGVASKFNSQVFIIETTIKWNTMLHLSVHCLRNWLNKSCWMETHILLVS